MPHTHIQFHRVPVKAYQGNTSRWIVVEQDGVEVTAFLDVPQILSLIAQLQATLPAEQPDTEAA
jgi:hypothetical protein